jgi:Zn finger protein HypA/HybF involved in hydrogenase expression
MEIDTEVVRAMLDQALSEARARHADQVTALHLVLYDPYPETERALRDAVDELRANTPAEHARVCTRRVPSRFVCWNCCGLCFESDEPEPMCPNCGESGLLVPPDIIFALERVEVV